LAATLAGNTWAADARPRSYGRVLLLDERGTPLKVASLKPQTNYVFHYPFEATPVFLLDLGKPAAATQLQTRDRQSYQWPGGIGPRRSLVAFSAICAHKLVYPTKELSFISFRKTRARKGVQELYAKARDSGAIQQKAQQAQPAATRTAWITFGALVLSLLTAVLGAMAGRRTAPVPVRRDVDVPV
jgi:Rieske Fe-S protein